MEHRFWIELKFISYSNGQIRLCSQQIIIRTQQLQFFALNKSKLNSANILKSLQRQLNQLILLFLLIKLFFYFFIFFPDINIFADFEKLYFDNKKTKQNKGKKQPNWKFHKYNIYIIINISLTKMSIKDFQLVSKLGDGAYSTVYKAVRKIDNNTYAIKRVKMVSLSQKQKQNALNQIRILASINHPNIISYKQAFIDENMKSLYIVMEFCNKGDLSHLIEEKKNQGDTFSETEIWNIYVSIVRGLNQLHKMNIFHRDIKPANIFLHQQNGHYVAKLGDMNVSKISEKGLCMTQTGTPYYASPQVWKDKPYNFKSDIWSLGCVLYQMITSEPPFKAQDMEGLFKKVTRGIYSKIPAQYSQDLSNMIRCLLQVNPDIRPTCCTFIINTETILKMASVVKKNGQQKSNQKSEKQKLLQTIRAGQSFSQLSEQLPKPNYLTAKFSKQKVVKSLMQSIDQKNDAIDEGTSEKNVLLGVLPFVEKQKLERKTRLNNGNSDRLMLREKSNANIVSRQRKKSEAAFDKPVPSETNFQSSKNSNSHTALLKQVKLPKLENRFHKIKQKMQKQKSLRVHKIYE